jgi:hypothetical protein
MIRRRGGEDARERASPQVRGEAAVQHQRRVASDVVVGNQPLPVVLDEGDGEAIARDDRGRALEDEGEHFLGGGARRDAGVDGLQDLSLGGLESLRVGRGGVEVEDGGIVVVAADHGG